MSVLTLVSVVRFMLMEVQVSILAFTYLSHVISLFGQLHKYLKYYTNSIVCPNHYWCLCNTNFIYGHQFCLLEHNIWIYFVIEKLYQFSRNFIWSEFILYWYFISIINFSLYLLPIITIKQTWSAINRTRECCRFLGFEMFSQLCSKLLLTTLFN